MKKDNITVITTQETRSYWVDNSGEKDVSTDLQKIFDQAAEDYSATFIFAPGVYYVNQPLQMSISSIKMVGNGHGGVEMHGTNLAGGSVLRFGPQCGPDCLTFNYAGQEKSFPAGEIPWQAQAVRVDIEKMTFIGYNNTGVDTAAGYSRFRDDEPNFRGLGWYPAADRYNDIEKEGQRALVIPKAGNHQKAEMFRLTDCYFTELYVGAEVAASDVTYITNCWFAQMVYGVRYHGPGQCMFISNNCFADLETGLILAHPIMSNIHHNSFAYVSKCFEIAKIQHSTINGNSLFNWERSTGAAAHGAFCYIGGPSENLTMNGNSIKQAIDSRTKTTTADAEPNGRSFMHFENCKNLVLADNVVDTVQSQSVIRLHNCSDCSITDNIIKFGPDGNAVAQTGECSNNFYRPIDPEQSSPFDKFLK